MLSAIAWHTGSLLPYCWCTSACVSLSKPVNSVGELLTHRQLWREKKCVEEHFLLHFTTHRLADVNRVVCILLMPKEEHRLGTLHTFAERVELDALPQLTIRWLTHVKGMNAVLPVPVTVHRLGAFDLSTEGVEGNTPLALSSPWVAVVERVFTVLRLPEVINRCEKGLLYKRVHRQVLCKKCDHRFVHQLLSDPRRSTREGTSSMIPLCRERDHG
mmetsp:Transcript_37414/g.86958  ORF Transcript_37414/g.86958 Transcript_37414/m.86958 type:complete len:216 (-) Transcript_37414:1063-1710(-)